MQKIDIRKYKAEFRAFIKQKRLEMTPEEKSCKDQLIAKRLFETTAYQSAEILVTYVSTSAEIDTINIIRQAWADGKRVVAPRCVENYLMDFHEIFSMEDLSKGSFSVLEPIPERCPIITNFKNSICIVPGLSFDKHGYRLGYGKGYYDRFLCRYHNAKIGMCYAAFLKGKLPRGRFDVAVDMLLTENNTFILKNKCII